MSDSSQRPPYVYTHHEFFEFDRTGVYDPIDANYCLNNFVEGLESITNQLIAVYKLNKNIGKSIFDALRDVVSAVNDGAENALQLLRTLASTKAKMVKNGNLRQWLVHFVHFF